MYAFFAWRTRTQTDVSFSRDTDGTQMMLQAGARFCAFLKSCMVGEEASCDVLAFQSTGSVEYASTSHLNCLDRFRSTGPSDVVACVGHHLPRQRIRIPRRNPFLQMWCLRVSAQKCGLQTAKSNPVPRPYVLRGVLFQALAGVCPGLPRNLSRSLVPSPCQLVLFSVFFSCCHFFEFPALASVVVYSPWIRG